jgi:hypothetical protein
VGGRSRYSVFRGPAAGGPVLPGHIGFQDAAILISVTEAVFEYFRLQVWIFGRFLIFGIFSRVLSLMPWKSDVGREIFRFFRF